MAPRGLSAEEKRVKLLEIFHETKDFYQLKELEKLGPKMKGIVSQSVKEVLQGLVDDGLVQADKIGSSNFFWSFPSQRGATLNARLGGLKETQDVTRSQIEDLKTSLVKEKSQREDTETRRVALERLTSLQSQLNALREELDAYGTCDPVKIEEKRRAITLGKEAAVRWTENYGLLLSYFSRRSGGDCTQIRQYLGVGDDYEDIL